MGLSFFYNYFSIKILTLAKAKGKNWRLIDPKIAFTKFAEVGSKEISVTYIIQKCRCLIFLPIQPKTVDV